jgi:hypothetical protein
MKRLKTKNDQDKIAVECENQVELWRIPSEYIAFTRSDFDPPLIAQALASQIGI